VPNVASHNHWRIIFTGNYWREWAMGRAQMFGEDVKLLYKKFVFAVPCTGTFLII